MQNLSFTACSFIIRESYSKSNDKVLRLNEEIDIIDENNNQISISISELFTSFFNNYHETITEESINKTFSIEFKETNKGENEEFLYLYAIIRSGYFGNYSEITNIESKQVKYKKGPKDADEMKFYMYIVIPRDNAKVKVQKGMMFFSNISVFGVKSITTRHLQSYIKTKYSLSINFKSIAPKLFLEKNLTRKSLNRMVLTRNHKSTNTANDFYSGYGRETKMFSNMNLTEKAWDKLIKKITYFVNGNFRLFELDQVEYENVRVEVLIGEKKRMINLNNLENLSIIEAIPNSVKKKDGQIDEKKLITHLEETSLDYLSEMVLEIT
ncbi:hypothetical protein SANA_22630 [Gottschalkiaceae bacterium SANA]|nr:hypothetical protein SANA_22630 [Gottschalkiaceae bacterium SANA]